MFNRVLIPLDGSSLAEQALGPGAAIARASGAAVDVVSVYEPTVLTGSARTSRSLGMGRDAPIRRGHRCGAVVGCRCVGDACDVQGRCDRMYFRAARAKSTPT